MSSLFARSRRAAALCGVLALLATLFSVVPAGSVAAATHTNALVPERARSDTPVVLNGSVRDVQQVGSRVVFVGDFTQIEQDGVVHDQPYIGAYFLDSGQLDTDFDPVVDRDIDVVRAAENGSGLYIGGRFNSIDGVNKRKLAKLSQTGDVVGSFSANAFAKVQSLAVGNGKVYVGGNFRKIRGIDRLHLAAVDAITGVVDPGFDLPLTTALGRGGAINVFDLDLTSDSNTLLVVHTAATVAGQHRTGIALVDTSGPTAALLPWHTDFYADELPDTGGVLNITAGAIAPDDAFFVTVATGGDNPPTNDTANKFSMFGGADRQPQWTSRHFDSIYAVDISDTAVYVGGHFQYQEAPGSTDPYPGDPDINYGAGTGLGPVVLGDEVVPREQLGALDPATGKSLDWDPGASGFHGVEALTVIPRGLLIGHDGSRIGGVETGRTGFLDFDADVFGNTIDTFITSPRSGRVYVEGQAVDFAGQAVAPAGVQKVQIEVQDINSRQWLRRDGSMGSYQNIVTTITSTGPDTVDWDYAATLPEGNYRMWARVFDANGVKDPTKAFQQFDVMPAGGVVPPETTITAPDFNQVLTSNTVHAAGRATDDVGVAGVQISFYDTENDGYLQADGSIGGFASFPATLAQPGAGISDWTITHTVPDGSWRIIASATDVDGNKDPSTARRTFLVQPDNTPPTVTISSPTEDQNFTGQQVTIQGTASDDSGVRKVRLHVRHETTHIGAQPNGFVGPARWVDVAVTPTDGSDVTFSYQTPALSPGRYRVLARAVDDAGALTPGANQDIVRYNLVVPGDDPPDTDITSLGSYEQDFPDNDLAFDGTATDDNGVDGVYVTIFDTDTNLYVQSDGTPGSTRELLPVTVDDPGAPSTTWSYSRTLPDGNYRISAWAQDTADQYDLSDSGSRCTCLIFPRDADPTTQLNTPVDGAPITGGRVVAGGRVFDAEAVVGVQVLIRNTATNQGPRINGTLGSPQWVSGFLTNPGGPGSDFQYTSIPLPAGSYLVRVRAVDSVGKVDQSYEQVNVTLQ